MASCLRSELMLAMLVNELRSEWNWTSCLEGLGFRLPVGGEFSWNSMEAVCLVDVFRLVE